MDCLQSLLEWDYLPYVIGGAVVLASLPVISRIFCGKCKLDVSKYPRDKVILFQVRRGPFAPSMSPFALKLETYLRMAEIPYQNELCMTMSQKGQTPWILYNGKEVADSQFSIEYLNRVREVNLNSGLSPAERGTARAYRIMVEDHLHWVMLLTWFWYGMSDPAVYAVLKLAMKGFPMFIVRWWGKTLYKRAKGQGIGRHTKDEVMGLGMADIRSISAFLGKKSFLMGDQPCEEDCAVFAVLAQVYWHQPGPLEQLVKGECGNLGDYCERMKARYWPDWEDCITAGGTWEAAK